MTGTEVKRGVYRHFKGKLYFVHEVVLNVENDEPAPTVLYEALYGKPGRLFVRSLANFTEIVEKPEFNYLRGPRFYRAYPENDE